MNNNTNNTSTCKNMDSANKGDMKENKKSGSRKKCSGK